jgi:hypothetical protein
MKRSRYTHEQIVRTLRQAEAGAPVGGALPCCCSKVIPASGWKPPGHPSVSLKAQPSVH